MPGVSAQTRLLAVAPHPDDETLGTGLLIQQVLAAGGAVRVLLLTDGDANPWPQRWLERRIWIGAAARARWGRRRRVEATHALAQLGVPAEALQALAWPDMGLTALLRADAMAATVALREALDAFRPTLVALPAWQDRHPDHGAAHVLCRLALAGWGGAPAVVAYPVHGDAHAADWPIAIDADAEEDQRKLAALAEHRSQTALSGGRLRRLAKRAERYARVSATGSTREEVRLPWCPPAALRPWLHLLVAGPLGVRVWRWPQAPLSRDADGGFRLLMPAGLQGQGPCFARLSLDWPSPWIFDHWGWCEL